MIYDTLEHLSRYQGIHPGVMKGLAFLAETDFSATQETRFELDGDKLFAFLQSYETRPVNDTPEAHRKYIDIQYLIEGEELVGVAPLEEMTDEVEARPENDIWFYHGPTTPLPIGNRRFLVLFPEDAHAPCIAAGAPAAVKKCVVKVLVE